MLNLPQPAIRREGQTIGSAVSGGPGLRRRQVRAGKGIRSHDGGGLRGFGILRRVDDGHTGRAGFAGHRIARGRLAIERQAQDLAEWLVGILGWRHALPVADGEEEIFAIRRKGDRCAELSALASLAIAPDHLEFLKARRILADLQLAPVQAPGSNRPSPGSE